MNRNTENLKTIKNIVGDDLFHLIIRCLPGETVYFADYSGYSSKSERDAAIKRDYYRGLSYQDITKKYGLHPSTVYRIVEKRLEKD